ncbi:MAG: FecR domain-containing protein, partial [Comamonas sp.]|nr:FecR domain-containing protein [Comamonas sp.]
MRPIAANHLPLPSLHVAAIPLVALVCAMAATPAAAQKNPLHTTAVTHRITAGDTLEQLAQRYLGDAALWPALQSHNSVGSPYRLQPGSVLEIPLQLMRAATASVDYVHGTAHVSRSGVAAPAARGMPLQEGDQIKLDPNAFVAVRLADGSTVRVQATSQVELSQLRRRGRSGSLQSVLQVQQGGVQVQVPGKPDAQRRLDIVTPVASTSVRGTEFDMQLLADGRTTSAVLKGRTTVQSLADAEKTSPTAVLLARTGIAVSADGHAGPVTPLLPAPAAGELPSLNEDAQWLNLPL